MSFSEAKTHFEEARKLKRIVFSDQVMSFSFDLQNLQEKNFHLDLQKKQARDLLLNVTKSLDSLTTFLNQEKYGEGVLKPNFGCVSLASKKLANLLDNLNELKMRAETEDLTFHQNLMKSQENLAELSEKLEFLETLEFGPSESTTIKFQNQRELTDLEQEKTDLDFQIEKLEETLQNTKALQDKLWENIRITGAKIVESEQIKNENFRKSSSLFEKLGQETKLTASQEYHKTVVPLQQKEKKLFEALKKQQALIQLQGSGKKFHFIFLVDTSKPMKSKLSDVEKSLKTLLKYRTSKDLYSLISFSNVVSILNSKKKIRPPIEISLPKGEKGNSAFAQAIDQAFDNFGSSSLIGYTPILIIVTDALKSKWRTQSMKESRVNKVCERLQEYYNSFHEKGLLVFVSHFDPLNRKDLRNIARVANGDKTYFEGFLDNHDFLNCMKNIETLSKIFRDLDGSAENNSILREREMIQSELEIVRSSIVMKMKLIYGIEEKAKNRLLKEKDLNQKNDEIGFGEVGDDFQKIINEQEEEFEQTKKKINSLSGDISARRNRKQMLEQEIEEFQRKREETNLSQYPENNVILIDPENIDLNKCIHAFKRCADIFVEMSVDFLNGLRTLISKLAKIFDQLEDRIKERESVSLKGLVRAGLVNDIHNITSSIYSQTLGKENFEKPACENNLLSQCSEVQELIHNFL